MNNLSTSTKLHNATFLVGEIDIDTKRPQVIDCSSHDLLVKQIKVRDSRIPVSQSCKQPPNWQRTPTASSIHAMKIKQRVLTPFQQRIDFNRLDISRIASVPANEMRQIPEIVITEFLDENNNQFEYEACKENNQEESFSGNYNTHSGILQMEYSEW